MSNLETFSQKPDLNQLPSLKDNNGSPNLDDNY